MKIAIDDDNFLVLHPNSCRLLNVTLAAKKVLTQMDQGTGSGNFLMYPWVNRVEQNPFQIESEYKDGNGIPLHGLFVNDKRQITVKPLGADSIIVEMVPSLSVEGVPKFKEFYELRRSSLTVRIQTFPTAQITLPFCFGYHPYLQIQNESLEDLTLSTDISKQLQLNDKLLPLYPYQEKQTVLSSSESYDSLFQGGTYLTITNKHGFNVKISSELPYWQIYTPPDRKRIAVQPMSFTANVYEISAKGMSPSLISGKFTVEVWQQQQ